MRAMSTNEKHQVVVKNLERPTRLDRVLREQIPEVGRRAAQTLINAKKVRVNDRVVWICSWQVKNGDRIEVAGELPKEEAPTADLFDDAWIVAKHAELVAVNKPAGVLSHKTQATGRSDILAMAQARFGPVALFHRLDRDTSGVMVFTYPGPVNRYLDTAFKEQSIEKMYIACVADSPGLQDSGMVRAPMAQDPKRRERMIVAERGGKSAQTRYEVVARADGFALVKLWPLTGRTHQLRVHMAYLTTPILGDRLYGPKPPLAKRLLLHATKLILPDLDGFPERRFIAPLPEDFLAALPVGLRELATNIKLS
jgi:RluA family pseudouridine synthase